MNGSWKLGRLFGIDIFVHATFVLLLGWIAVSAYLREHTAQAVLGGVLFIMAIFGTVVLHELGHSLMARRFGIRTRDITLLPIGGVARLERMPEKPGEELLVALAGPLVNVVIALALFAVLSATGQAIMLVDPSSTESSPIAVRLFWVNVSLAIFNLIPAFPMDGGRALRAVLALGSDYIRATRVAAKLGRGIAVVLGLVGLLYNPMLVLVALFVWTGAGAEAAGVETKASLHGLPTYTAMETQFASLHAHDTLHTAAHKLLGGAQVDFPVVDPNGTVVGLLTRHALIAGLAQKGPDGSVESTMERQFPVAHPAEMLEVALARLTESSSKSMPVVADGRLVGMLTADNIAEFLMVRDAIGAGRRRHALHFAA
ncbi:MAG TPA: site-2 protease family protein [Labilithrix sp.]|jgi:Zn-dependent protease|nr:site-2 protease family protein [Labilithrix sp.]